MKCPICNCPGSGSGSGSMTDKPLEGPSLPRTRARRPTVSSGWGSRPKRASAFPGHGKFTTKTAWSRLHCWALLACALGIVAAGAQEQPRRPIDGILDNSFLVEEAYNQEPGVVQNIFTAVYGLDWVLGPEAQTADLSFTQEWPVFSQKHQFSYTIPYSFFREDGDWNHGLGDVLLNYRYQAYLNNETLTAFSPRFTLVLPTGSASEGFGNGTLGYQWNLPFSTTWRDRWFFHANAGLTYLPDAGEPVSQDLLNYNFGASTIYAVNDRFNLMLEWVGYGNEIPDASGGSSREFSSVISPGARYAFNFAHDSQLVLGLGVPVGLSGNAAKLGLFLYVSFELDAFGKD